jgi:micrococcal nuclease
MTSRGVLMMKLKSPFLVLSIYVMVIFVGSFFMFEPKEQVVHSSTQAVSNSISIKPNSKIKAKVLRVVDGDTLLVELPNRTQSKMRLIGVNTPETVKPQHPAEPYGKEASNYTKKRLTGATVTLEFDVGVKDRYGRLLAYVWIGKELYNETLVKDGYARVMTIQPNVKYQDVFIRAEREARKSHKGLWGL